MKKILLIAITLVLSFNTYVFASELTNEAAAAEYEEFYNAVKHMEDNPDLEDFFNVYRLQNENDAKEYEKYCNDTAESWKSKSDFDKFLWYETYLRIVVYMHFSNYDYYFGSEENFINNMLSDTLRKFEKRGTGSTEEAEAYKKLMLWQYQYIKEKGVPYNFILGKNYLETLDGTVPGISNNSASKSAGEKAEEASAEVSSKELAEIEEAYKELVEDMTPSELDEIKQAFTDEEGDKKEEPSKLVGLLVLGVIIAVIAGVVVFLNSRK